MESLCICRQCFSTKLLLMKTPIVPKLTKIYTVKDLEVLVVSREIGKCREFSQASRVLIVDQKECFFSHLRDEVVTI